MAVEMEVDNLNMHRPKDSDQINRHREVKMVVEIKITGAIMLTVLLGFNICKIQQSVSSRVDQIINLNRVIVMCLKMT